MSSYSSLVSEQARTMGVGSVPVVEEDFGYASTDGKAIYVNPGFMSRIHSSAGEAGVRFILGHELGHIHHGMHKCGHGAELEADEFGARSIAGMQGGTEDAICGVMSELNGSATETHPASSSREQVALRAFRAAESAKEIDTKVPEKNIRRFPRTR